jgi:hypothetical protein
LCFIWNQSRKKLSKHTNQRPRVLIFVFTCPQNILLCDWSQGSVPQIYWPQRV